METKDRIYRKPKLFAAKGYDGVSMRQIAAAVGIQAASLYSHYAGKESIFVPSSPSPRALRPNHAAPRFEPGPNPDPRSMLGLKERPAAYLPGALPLPAQGRDRRSCAGCSVRNNPRFDRRKNLSEPVRGRGSGIPNACLEALIAAGEIRKGDPAVTALHFYAPFLLLLNRYDRKPEREAEALAAVEAHVSQFVRRYGKKAK